MAQDIEIANAQYNDVPSIEVPLQGGGTASFVDTTDADASASEIDMGKTAYVNGVKLTGTRSGGSSYSETELFYSVSGVTSGTIPLSGNISDYDLIQITATIPVSGGVTYYLDNLVTSSELLGIQKQDKKKTANTYNYSYIVDYSVVGDNALYVESQLGNVGISKVVGIKFGS